MADRMSSSPRPGPRHRPRSRKAKTITKRHQSTDMAISELRALSVMTKYIVATILTGKRKEERLPYFCDATTTKKRQQKQQ